MQGSRCRSSILQGGRRSSVATRHPMIPCAIACTLQCWGRACLYVPARCDYVGGVDERRFAGNVLQTIFSGPFSESLSYDSFDLQIDINSKQTLNLIMQHDLFNRAPQMQWSFPQTEGYNFGSTPLRTSRTKASTKFEVYVNQLWLECSNSRFWVRELYVQTRGSTLCVQTLPLTVCRQS